MKLCSSQKKRNQRQSHLPRKSRRPQKRFRFEIIHRFSYFVTIFYESYCWRIRTNILRILFRRKWSSRFGFTLVPSFSSVAPDYANVINNPMDFFTIRHKVGNNEYDHLDEFKKDVELISVSLQSEPLPFFRKMLWYTISPAQSIILQPKSCLL